MKDQTVGVVVEGIENRLQYPPIAARDLLMFHAGQDLREHRHTFVRAASRRSSVCRLFLREWTLRRSPVESQTPNPEDHPNLVKNNGFADAALYLRPSYDGWAMCCGEKTLFGLSSCQ